MKIIELARSLSGKLLRRWYLLAGTAGSAMALLALPWLLNGQPPSMTKPGPNMPTSLGDSVMQAYPLTPQAGDWLILAASYTGTNGKELASQVVRSLRRRDTMPAFIFNKGQQEQEKQEREIKEIRKRDSNARVKTVHIEEQFAVLIGGFKDQDAAAAALKHVQQLPLPEIDLGPDVVPYAIMQVRNEKKQGYDQMFVNPFWTSMVVPNPLLLQKPVPKADPILKKLNDNEEYSLLKNPAPYTLYVRDYFGASMIQQGNTNRGPVADQIGNFNSGAHVLDVSVTQANQSRRPWAPGEMPRNVLDAGAKQAHETARCLKLLNYEAYVLHTPEASVVAIGGFSGNDDPRMIELANTLARDGRVAVMQLMSPPLALAVPRP